MCERRSSAELEGGSEATSAEVLVSPRMHVAIRAHNKISKTHIYPLQRDAREASLTFVAFYGYDEHTDGPYDTNHIVDTNDHALHLLVQRTRNTFYALTPPGPRTMAREGVR